MRYSRNAQSRLKRLNLGYRTSRAVIPVDATLTVGSHSLAQWMADRFNHNFDEYDKAIDAVYNETHIGGSSYHHIVDGQHSIFGAYQAVKDVKTDDSLLTEIVQAGEHLLRDTASVSGINPFFSLSNQQFDQLASAAATFGISKPFLADALTINGPELIGGIIAVGAGLILGRKADPSMISGLSGAYIVSSIASANPFLFPLAAGGLVYSFKHATNKKEALIQGGKGAIVSGSALTVSSLVGGPVWLGCMCALATALLVQHALDKPDKAFERVQAAFQPAASVQRQVILKVGRKRFDNGFPL